MRTSVSCEACRSKVKCMHNGSPPCNRCDKFGYPGCQLTRPVPKSSRQAAAKANAPTRAEPARPAPVFNSESPVQFSSGQSNPVDAHCQALPVGTILKALHVFCQNFPEIRMIHPVLFQRAFQPGRERSVNNKALLAALLAVVKKHEHYHDEAWISQLLPSKDYASFACDVLATAMLQTPDINVVQAHLILTLYEWGIRDFQKAWIHCGIAVRIMQSLYSIRVAPFPLVECPTMSKSDELSHIVETATYWACFVLDCTINSGTYNPRMLSLAEMRKLQIARSPPTTGFAFGNKQESIPPERCPLSLDQCNEILVYGFSIYSHVMAFVYNDGRKAPGMCAPENCPWVPDSEWAKCRQELEAWRNSMDSRLFYPDYGLGLHISNGSSRSFVYINLLYYHCILMLQREYFPFLPKPDTMPQGPTDPPFLEAQAPPDWWQKSAQELFEAAAHVTNILCEASEWSVTLMTPIPGFCGFSACYMNLYACHFPGMTAGYSSRPKELFDKGMEYLREFKKAWDLGDSWVKTIQNASFLFERVNSNTHGYRTRSRLDFEVLHQSAHEFRTVDRSDQHMAAIREAGIEDQLSRTTQDANESMHEFSVEVASFDEIALMEDQALWPTWYSSAFGNGLDL